MKSSEYIGVLQSNIRVDKEIATTLEEIIEEYPYFQSARAVYLKYLHDQGSFKYNGQLKKTAAFTLDRTVLFDYITSDRFKGIDDIKPIWVEQPKIDKLVVNVLEELPIVSQITPEVITISVQPEVVPELIEELPIYVVNVLEELPIASQITPEVITISVQPEAVVSEVIAALPVYVVNVLEELPIVSQITPEVITISVQPEAIVSEVIATLPVYVVNVLEELPIVSQITPEVITISVKPESVPELIEELPIYVVDVKEEFPIVHQVTSAVITIKEKSVKTLQSQEIITEEIEEPLLSEVIEERLELGKPLEFSRDEKHSFQEWLQLTAMKPIDRSTPPPAPKEVVVMQEESVEKEQKISKQELIDRFIEANPRMPRANAKGENEITTQAPSVERPNNNTTLMTETLAKVYLEQKKYDRAIQAYEILILKNPEKKSLFADRIWDIKQLKKNNT